MSRRGADEAVELKAAKVGFSEPARAPEIVLTPKLEERAVVEEALNRIWAHAHRASTPQEGAWEAFRDGVLHAVSDPIRLVPSSGLAEAKAAGALSVGSGPVADTPQTAELVVTADMNNAPSDAWRIAYVRRRLAPTLARFEASGAGSREQRVDMLVRALTAMRGSELAAALVPELVRYLQGQPEADRGPGYFVTLANLGQLLDAGRHHPRRPLGLAIYHRVLAGCWALAQSRAPGSSGRPFSTVPVTAHNVAGLLAQEVQENRLEVGEEGRRAMRALVTISAASAEPVNVEGGRARRIAEALGLERADPASALTVIARAGSVADAWTPAPVDRAWLEAARAVVAAAEPSPGREVAGTFFNAGISVLKTEVEDEGHLSARLVINLLGLRWSLLLARGQIYEALVEYNGLDCAVNLLATHTRVRGGGFVIPEALEGLVRELARLAYWPPLATLPDRPFREAVGRITGAARNLGVEPTEPFQPEQSLPLVEGAWRALSPLAGGEASDDEAVNSALVVSKVFTEHLGRSPYGLWALVRQAVELRADKDRALVEQYKPFVAQPGGAAAVVLNEAGRTSSADWEGLEAALLDPLAAIAPILGALSFE